MNGIKDLFILAAVIGIVGVVAHSFGEGVMYAAEHSGDPHLSLTAIVVTVIGALSFVSFYLTREKPLPSFVVMLLLGIAAQPLLDPIIENKSLLSVLVGLGATLILSQGGFETDFVNFRKLFWKIIMLAFPGVLLTAFGVSLVVEWAGEVTGIGTTVTVAVLLGALLASTDPAAIIPLLGGLRFRKADAKDIVVSESALNDVVGALLTLALVGLAVTFGSFGSISEGYGKLFTPESGVLFLKQLGFGALFGLIGYALLTLLKKHKTGHGFESGADAAYFISVPLMALGGALAFGGSGFLAAFVAGLLFRVVDDIKRTEHFFGWVIDGFAKPVVFLLLGALVDIKALTLYAPVGIIVALLFIFVIRPAMVFIMLGLFTRFGKERITLQELLFISWVRETGAIPAVLLVTVSGIGLKNIESLVPIGMWVILFTLIVQPPLTPWFARKLGMVK